MRDIARTRNGRWVEVETAEDVETVNRRSRTYLGGHARDGMGAFGYRFVALVPDGGKAMPVAALISDRGPSMVLGMWNGDPFPNYQDDILALAGALGTRVAPGSYPYRHVGTFGVVPALSEVGLTPLFDDDGGARWVIVGNVADDQVTALPGFGPVTAALPLDRRERGRSDGETFLALEFPHDDAPPDHSTIVRIPSGASRREGGKSTVVATDGRDPYRKPDVRAAIEGLGHHLGLDMSEGACHVPRPHRPGPSTRG